jgi:dolichol-phosphate mannosyltransferase
MNPEITVVIPVYNEGAAVVPCLDRILQAVTSPCEVLVVYDRPDDTTVPHIEQVTRSDRRVRGVLNGYGPGPANAIRAGFDQALSPVTVVTMADGSPVHARRPAGRRSAAEAQAVEGGRGIAAAVGPGRHPGCHQ